MSAGTDEHEIVFDGGSIGNPGRGYGSYRLRRAGEEWSTPTRLEFGRRDTNNEAEYRALIAALDALADAVPQPGRCSVTVRGDSRLVVEQMKGAWKVRAANLAPLNSAARRAAGRFGSVRYVWQSRDTSVRLLGH